MKIKRLFLPFMVSLLWANLTFAYINPQKNKKPNESNGAPNHATTINFRENCNSAVAQTDQSINNVRARLTTGGDVWWDGTKGSYIVPKVGPGEPEVSSIFAGGVWLGGLDDGGSLKVAAQTYGRPDGNFDFWPGPLEESGPDQGTTEATTCKNWDRFFKVRADEINLFRAKWRVAENAGEMLAPGDIPLSMRGWPARGNPYFVDIYNFELPFADQGLAGFHDEDGDGIYDPLQGDFPIIQVKGCEESLGYNPQIPDEMIFWIYNDAGNTHAETTGDKIQMEIQVQAFSYATNDEINNMTFQRYKLINRAIESIHDTYFAMWTDADIGCFSDDYIGCDVGRSLAYTYNEDATDGDPGGCTCGGVNTYCNDIPIMGIDYFRGPHNEFGEELGMSSFTYYNNASVGNPPPGTTDPDNAQEYYNYMSGYWKDGSPFQEGGDGFQEGTEASPYVFSDPPDDESGWSMCSEGTPFGDRRTVQASGPFRLDPGAVNELIIGAVWVPHQNYPCPNISKLLEADDIAQKLFRECFAISNGPDAPDVDFIEMDQEVIAVFTNGDNEFAHNNYQEKFEETGLRIPDNEADDLYRFEGYKLFQLSEAGVDLTPENRADPSKVRLVYQVDVKNGISQIFNWESYQDGADIDDLIRVQMVDGADKGIRHTFKLTEDQFADGDRRLINHKKYYYVAVAYAYNNYKEFDPITQEGQREAYLEGRRNIGPVGDGKPYTVIPRPIVDRKLNASYGEGLIVTRRDGKGSGRNFLDISDKTRAEIEAGFATDTPVHILEYKPNRAPIEISIYNPLAVANGNFKLELTDELPSNDRLDDLVTWEVRNLDDPNAEPVLSEGTIDVFNEQIVSRLGYTIGVGQVADVGTVPFEDKTNGGIGAEIDYLKGDAATPWLTGVPDGLQVGNGVLDASVFDYIPNGPGEVFYPNDPYQSLSHLGDGFFVPYWLCDWKPRAGRPYITPAWTSSGNSNSIVHGPTRSNLSDLNNVDIVFTSNKDLWSRCVIVETTGTSLAAVGLPTIGNQKHFDLRGSPSVTKEADENGQPKVDTENPGEGMGWFPGYAIDVETGQRLNVFFGESSVYDGAAFSEAYSEEATGADMMFNPGSQMKLNLNGQPNMFEYVAGGRHFVYVMDTPYDGCAQMKDWLAGSNALTKVKGIKDITWAGLIMTLPGQQMLSYAAGLIPEDVIVKLRVNSPYEVKVGTDDANGYPLYGFQLDGGAPEKLRQQEIDESLMQIGVVPNPYYGFSEYEGSQFENIVKITNLPAKCTVSIYSLDGRFIRRYDRDEVGTYPVGLAIERNQISPDIEWDLKNNKGIPIASGVYLIHIQAAGLGERTIKWFGVNRQFDPTGL